MTKSDKNKVVNESSIRRVQYQDEDYFVIEDVAQFIEVNLSRTVVTVLPVSGKYLRTATLEDIERGVIK